MYKKILFRQIILKVLRDQQLQCLIDGKEKKKQKKHLLLQYFFREYQLKIATELSRCLAT